MDDVILEVVWSQSLYREGLVSGLTGYSTRLTADDRAGNADRQAERQQTTVGGSVNREDVVSVLALCGQGDTLELAEELIAANATRPQVQHAIQRRQIERREIAALCKFAKVPELAEGYIAGRFAVPDVRAHLVTITAKVDQVVDIDCSLDPDQMAGGTAPASKGKRPTSSEIYAERGSK